LAVVSEKKTLKGAVFIDGASRGNPGPASIGMVFKNSSGQVVKSFGSKIGTATNNVAEYSALIAALQQALMMGWTHLDVFTDSELLAKQCAGEYKVKEDSLKILSFFVRHLRGGFEHLKIAHVPREQNKLADQEANKALDQEFFL
jgi:ribonuclease HI